MSLPKKGKSLPTAPVTDRTGEARPEKFAVEIATALDRAANHHRVYVKTIAAWTGANERTVKHWLSGKYGPSGDHLMILARHSDEVLGAILSMVGRRDLLLSLKLDDIERRIGELANLAQEVRARRRPKNKSS